VDDDVVRAKQGLSLSVGLSHACTANAGCTVRVSSAGNLITIFTHFWGDVRHFVSGWPNRLLPGMRPRHPWWHWHLWGCV